jgi:hypothetical protein
LAIKAKIGDVLPKIENKAEKNGAGSQVGKAGLPRWGSRKFLEKISWHLVF